ncbi:concanavalin A-like lectin/glucanase [Rhizopus microsporus ATCC 52813]|uniref:Concanavalin A-like lectin/glucanase n=2 Tax=Rhizopus microsporus TaxID=58291 RepID=A0A2G4SWD4_RHIZD|nr:concanavalin A-like lectin/glucanase [Rhizopus microsporus ATCC 52813]PHZ13065.1 concanavalin A-like lectin/glucanase [Rhizopus microsporus ATCC 52813]
MHLQYHSIILVFSILLQAVFVDAARKCTDVMTDFTKGHEGWTELSGSKEGWSFTSQGLKMDLIPPEDPQPSKDKSEGGLPYNKNTSPSSPSFQYKDLVQYGRITFELKTAKAAGAITAAILMAPGKDEIDFEMLGGEPDKVQTNYFYGKNIVYGVNGGNHDVEDTTTGFHKYTIDWNAERIIYLFDGKVIRTVERKSTCKRAVCEYPTEASHVQVGIWDASKPASTAEWAKGPIDWKKYKSKPISAIIKSVKIECNSK